MEDNKFHTGNIDEKDRQSAWFDLCSHFDAAMENMFAVKEYGTYELQVLKTMAAFGEPMAAEFLADAYDLGECDENREPQPLEVLRWSLIQKFLEGDGQWIDFIEDKRFLAINANDRQSIIHEVHAWIRENPIAHSSVLSKNHNIPRQVYYLPDN